MLIRVSEIPDEGLRIEGVADVCRGPSRTRLGARRSVASSRRTATCVFVRGDLEARVPQHCGRCLEPYTVTVHPDVDARFVPRPAGARGGAGAGRDDLETDFYEHGQLDLDGPARDRDHPGAADEAALPRGLPRALPGVRRQPERHRVRVRDARRPIRGWRPSRTAAERDTDRRPDAACQSDATRRRAAASAARTTSWPRRRARSARSAGRSSCRTASAPTAASTRGEKSSRSRANSSPARPSRAIRSAP